MNKSLEQAGDIMSASLNSPGMQAGMDNVIEFDKAERESNRLPLEVCDRDRLVFALDIGTRTVIGVAGIQEKSGFRILASDVIEHSGRAMQDGQIHDIAQVAATAGQVRERLENKLGIKLSKVAIAAAGRALKTIDVKVEREIDRYVEIDRDMVGSLEIEGIQKAQLQMEEEMGPDEKTQFYCVGYSVVNYYLNDFLISSLTGHMGKKIGADILATFLPRVVIDSLYTVVNRIGLEVANLTLEPIAALNVTIPRDLRLLNLVLVDVGAGTSDIAITRDGSVIAYAMAPIAGDEVSEVLIHHFLVDFETAESMKMEYSGGADPICFTDIMGKQRSVTSAEIAEVLKPCIEGLAAVISQKILEFNRKSPNAIFLVGGGSQIRGLAEMLADQLKLQHERVAVRGRDVIKNVDFSGMKMTGPECITPVGIAVTASGQRGEDFLSVTVDGKNIRLLNARRLLVADALILLGYNPNQLIGRTGRGVTFLLNGVKKSIRGGHGKPAEIYLNESLSNIEAVLKDGDSIRVIPAEDGLEARISVSDFVRGRKPGMVRFAGRELDISPVVSINGRQVPLDTLICDSDEINVMEAINIADLYEFAGIRPDDGFTPLVNGIEASLDYIIKDDDSIEIKHAEPMGEGVQIPLQEPQNGRESVQGRGQQQEPLPPDVFRQFQVTVNGKEVLLDSKKNQYMYVDIFNYIEFDLSKPQGSIVLKLNGRQAGYTDPIKPGDVIDIYWTK